MTATADRETVGVLGQDVTAVERPWGAYAVLAEDGDWGRICAVKILIVDPGQVLSLQTHEMRAERWMALDPGATATIGDATEYMVVGHLYDVGPRVLHRIANGSDRPVRIVEVMIGVYDENDIVRVEDEYGRC